MKLSSSQRNALERATAKYEAALPGSPAISYLEERGIPKEVASTFRLGSVEIPEKGHEHVQGRLSIPYLTPKGVVDLKFRAIEEVENGKYLGIGGNGPSRLFNVQSLHTGGDCIAITEGELDCLVLSGLCGIPSVGIAGVNNWQKHFKRLFEDFDRVLIVMDDDKAGHEAAQKLRKELRNGVITTLKGGDINELYLEHGSQWVREHLGVE